MDRNDENQTSSTGTGYSSHQEKGDRGTEGLTGGENFNDREEFSGRPNVTEERIELATDAGEPASEPLEGEG